MMTGWAVELRFHLPMSDASLLKSIYVSRDELCERGGKQGKEAVR